MIINVAYALFAATMIFAAGFVVGRETVPPAPDGHFLHLQATDASGHWAPGYVIPLPWGVQMTTQVNYKDEPIRISVTDSPKSPH